MDMSALTIYNLPPQSPKFDSVGIFYITFCAVWTVIIVAGMVFCWMNRQLPILKVRGLGLSFASVIFLHLYWILSQIVYPVGVTMRVLVAYDIQYFVMGTWFPLGIALFHAANLRLLHVAELQKRFTHPALIRKGGNNGANSSWISRIRSLKYDTKVLVFIGIGITVQTLLTVCMWLVCRKYHPSFGVRGTEVRGETLPEQIRDLYIGWEWWPSVVWQFVWTWGVAPSLIWRAWNIRDTMGWRTQTIGACLSGLHATPMFLIASYSRAFDKVNAYFPPSQWIQLHTMVLEGFLIFVPAYQVIKLWQTNRKVIYSNDKWETSSQSTTIRVNGGDKGSTFELVEKDQVLRYASNGYNGDRLLTMTALNRVLHKHPEPLQEFSAYNDFSGENIAFLTRVAKWKVTWSRDLSLDQEQRADMYNAALKIYIDFISPRDAEFPLNLASAQLKDLEAVFEASARKVCGKARVDPTLPFAFEMPFTFDVPVSREHDDEEAILESRYTGDISRQFGINVFDQALNHVKNLVLTNTWPKFVNEIRRRRSIDSDRSGMTDSSAETAVSRVTRFVKSLT
ncbi:hypothetical protein HBI18_112310 [Parastagonospora nodorum]|nr:hypothetical protein HBI18_112310 [Parastagonospora nodorum]